MPQNSKIAPEEQHWEPRFVAIFKCSPPPKEESAEVIKVANRVIKLASKVIKVASRTEINQNRDLQRVLKALQLGIISKRANPSAANPTIRYATFRPSRPTKPNDARLWLDKLLQADSQPDVQSWASKLAGRYVVIPNVQKGVLIFLLSSLKLEGNPETCTFVFKCDFEDISQLTPEQIFKRIEDAFEEDAKKGAQYPYFDGRKFERNTVRVFDALGDTQYWREFLGLVEKPSKLTVQAALLSELTLTRPKFVWKNLETLKSLEKGRSLGSDEHPIKEKDRLPSQEVERLVAKLPESLRDNKIPLSLDKARVWVPISEYGRNWTLAEQFSTRYVLLKGSQLETNTPGLTIPDLGCLPNLQEAIARLGAPLGDGLKLPISLDAAKNPILRVYELFGRRGIERLDEPGFLGFKNLKLKHITSAQAQEFIRFLRRMPVGALSLCRLVFGKDWLIDFTASSVTEWFNWGAIEGRRKLCANCKGVFSRFKEDLDAYQSGAPWPGEEIEKDGLALLDGLESCKSCGAGLELDVTLDKDIVVKEYLLGDPVNLKESVNALLWRNHESMQKAFASFEDFLQFMTARAAKPVVIFLYEPAGSYQGDFFKIISLTDSSGSISKRERELAEALSAFNPQTLADYQLLCKKHQSEERPRTGRLDLPPSLFLQRKGELAQYPTHSLFTEGPLRSVLICALGAWLAQTVRLDGETVHFGLPSRGRSRLEFPLVFSLTDVRRGGVSIFQKAKDWRNAVGWIGREIGISAGSQQLREYWRASLKSRSTADFTAEQFFHTLETVKNEVVTKKFGELADDQIRLPRQNEPVALGRTTSSFIELRVFLLEGKRISFQLNGDGYVYQNVGEVRLTKSDPDLRASELSELAREHYGRILEPVKKNPKAQEPTFPKLRALGTNLWDKLISPELRAADEIFCGLPDLTIFIVSDDPSFPWELVRPVRFKRPSRNDLEWWANKFSIGRWLIGSPPPARSVGTKRICYVAATGQDLRAAERERRHLEKMAGELYMAKGYNDLLKVLGSKDFDIIHFACHGKFDSNQPAESVLVLPDGKKLRPASLGECDPIRFRWKKNRPLVFLNSCHSGRTGSSLTGLEGWTNALISLNCGAFIGCGWEVEDRLAADFAIAFYRKFKGGMTLGKAVKEARGDIRDKEPQNSTWLAYYLFGNPNCLAN